MKLPNYDQLSVSDVLSYDPQTGVLTWKVNVGKARVGDVAGGPLKKGGHLTVGFKGRRYLAHRLAWLMHYGAWPVGDVDHKNGNPVDNAIENLRDVAHVVNTQNIREAHKGSAVPLLGVSRTKGGKYVAQLVAHGKRVLHRTFDTAEEAHAAYLEAKRRAHAGCTI
jgi:hypothetical protein